MYKIEQTAPNELQKVFGKVPAADEGKHLNFLPQSGITHKIKYDSFSRQPESIEKMTKEIDDFGNTNISETASVHKSRGAYPYWVTLKGNKYETAYVKTDDVKKIKNHDIMTREIERDYEGSPVGYDRVYYNNQGDVLEYSYFPNFLDPRVSELHPPKDALDEESILTKADRLINRLKNMG